MKNRIAITTKLVQFVKSSWLYFVFYLIMGFMQFLIKVFPNYSNIIQIIASILYMYFLIKLIFGIKEVDYLDRIFKFTIIVVVNSPLLVYSIVLFIRTFPGFIIRISDSSTWINFAGSIIGGSLTLFAVIFAFVLEKENREIELDKTQVPKLHVLSTFQIDNKDMIQKNISYEKNDFETIIINLDLKLRNISNYSAKNFNIILCEFCTYSRFELEFDSAVNPVARKDLKEYFYKRIKNKKILFGEYDVEVPISFAIEKKYIKEIDIEYYHTFNLSLSYTSQFEKINYQLDSNIDLSIHKEKIDKKNDLIEYFDYAYIVTINNLINDLSIVE